MSDDIQAAATGLDPANLAAPLLRGMTRIVIATTGNVQRHTRVDTGTLRRSWTHRVEASGRRGIVGTNISYATKQANDPLGEGWADTAGDLPGILADVGADFFANVRVTQ